MGENLAPRHPPAHPAVPFTPARSPSPSLSQPYPPCPRVQAAACPTGPCRCGRPGPTAPPRPAGKERPGWLKCGAKFSIPKQPSHIQPSLGKLRHRSYPPPRMLSITLPASVTPIHPYLDGDQGGGLERPWGARREGLEARAALQRVGEGVPAPAVPWHAGVPALGRLLPAGRGTGMLSAQHSGTLCFTLLCQGGDQGCFPVGYAPPSSPPTAAGHPCPSNHAGSALSPWPQ